MPKIIDQELQSPPFCLQVELTEGCNLRCSFCGLNGIRGKENNYKFLTVQNAEIMCDRLIEANWKPRIEFAMHGEPSVNPNMLEIIHLFRSRLGKAVHLMMTSNGAGFVKDPTGTIDSILQSLNVLALDWYEGVQLVPKIIQFYNGSHKVISYPQDQSGNPHKRRKPGEHDLVVVQDISEATKGTHASLNNHAGCGSPKNDDAVGKRCAKPFREISVRWDGNVSVCCNDWRGIYKCGNVFDSGFEAIWNGPEMKAARRKLYHGERNFGPCAGCDALSYRPGLLPDQKGLKTLPQATETDETVITSAVAGQPYTSPIWRPWESEKTTVD